jgi:hypothetical protein
MEYSKLWPVFPGKATKKSYTPSGFLAQSSFFPKLHLNLISASAIKSPILRKPYLDCGKPYFDPFYPASRNASPAFGDRILHDQTPLVWGCPTAPPLGPDCFWE